MSQHRVLKPRTRVALLTCAFSRRSFAAASTVSAIQVRVYASTATRAHIAKFVQTSADFPSQWIAATMAPAQQVCAHASMATLEAAVSCGPTLASTRSHLTAVVMECAVWRVVE